MNNIIQNISNYIQFLKNNFEAVMPVVLGEYVEDYSPNTTTMYIKLYNLNTDYLTNRISYTITCYILFFVKESYNDEILLLVDSVLEIIEQIRTKKQLTLNITSITNVVYSIEVNIGIEEIYGYKR